MMSSRPAAVVEVSMDRTGEVPGGLIRAAYRASRQGMVVLVLNGISAVEVDRALDAVVSQEGSVAGVVYCTPTTLEPFLEQSGWPRIAIVGTVALAADLAERGVRVLPPARALRALRKLGVEPAP
jgi:hypothetical protein